VKYSEFFADRGERLLAAVRRSHSDRPAAAIALSFSLGIALSLACRQYWFTGLLTGAAALIFAALLAFCRNRLWLALACGLAAISISGLLTALACRDAFPNSDLRALTSRCAFPLGEPVSFEGCIVKEAETRGDERVATVELTAFLRKGEWAVCSGKGILRIPESAPEDAPKHRPDLMRGTRVRGWANWNIPRNYENPGATDNAGMLFHRGIFLVGRTKSTRLMESIPGACADPWTRLANSVSNRVRQSLEPVREKEKGQPAAILASLVIGDYSSLNNTTREIFQNSGTFHVLVVSGLHVAWIAGLLLHFCKSIRVPERIRYVLAFFVILLYTCVVGAQASITRCLWMFLLYLIGRMIFRHADSVNILLGSAVILLAARPYWLLETGFQLSFISVLSIAMTAAPAVNAYLKPLLEPLLHCGNPDRLFLQPDRWHCRGRSLRTRCELFIEELTDTWMPAPARILLLLMRGMAAVGLALAGMILTSFAVQIWLAPLLACYFNRISWISPISNLLIVPLSSIVLCAGIVVALAANLPALGAPLLQLAASLASLLLHATVRTTTAAVAWQRCPTPSPCWVLAGILLLFAWSFFEFRRLWVSCSLNAVLLACLSFGSVPVVGALVRGFQVRAPQEQLWNRGESILALTFLDVGEGDSIIIRFPDMRVWVLDAGGLRQPHSQEDSGFDVGEAVVSRYLWHFWTRRIDRLILSHPDTDHAGGIPAVMQNFPIGGFDFSQAGPDAIMDRILSIARERHIAVRQPVAALEETIGPVKVNVLNPPVDRIFTSTNENSLVLDLSFRRFSVLLTGDLEKSGEAGITAQPGLPRCSLLKVAHHGSRSGTSDLFLDRILPRWAVISVGRNNPFSHPSKDTLGRLRRHGVRTFLTTDEGAITFETDGTWYRIKSHMNGVLDYGILEDNPRSRKN
jgi:competence protein ComEC